MFHEVQSLAAATLLLLVLDMLTPDGVHCAGLLIPPGVGWAMAMEGRQRSQPPAAGGTCAAAAFGRANAPGARARARVAPRRGGGGRSLPPKLWRPLAETKDRRRRSCCIVLTGRPGPDKAVRWRGRTAAAAATRDVTIHWEICWWLVLHRRFYFFAELFIWFGVFSPSWATMLQ
jgi:hypothetical protein